MSEGGARRAVAEIRFGEDRSSITKVGGRSIHQYWSLLGPHFRDVLLAPQRRSDDGGVAWTWREAADRKPPTASELAGVRKRLERANESFAENPVNPLMGDDRSGTSSQVLIDQVAAKVKAMAESLAAKSDAALAGFVCRTETGPMIHSWGVTSPAQIYYPDALESGVSGVVLVSGKPSEGYEVVIETLQGLSVARTHSDEVGEFLFSKIGPGRYRVRVTAGKVKFPLKGIAVTVERGAMTRLELPSSSSPGDPSASAAHESAASSPETSPGDLAARPKQERGGLGKVVGVLGLLVLLLGGGVWVWRKGSTADNSDERARSRSSSMAPEVFDAGEMQTHPAQNSGVAGGGGLSAAADGVGNVARRPSMRPTITTSHQQATKTSVSNQHASSTIGSRVVVQSSASEERGLEENSAGDTAVQPAASGETAQQESISDRDSSTSESNARAPKTTAISRRKNPSAASAGPAISSVLPQGGGAQAVDLEGVSLENVKPLSSGKIGEGPVSVAAAKKAPAPQGLGAVSVGEPPPAGAAEQEAASTPGTAPEDDPVPDAVTAGKPSAGQPQAKAPTVKVSVVNKGPDAAKALPGGEARNGDSAPAAAEKAGPVRSGATTKRSKVTTPGAGSTAPSGGAGVAGGSALMPPEQNAAATMPTTTKNQAGEPVNSAPGKGDAISPADSSPEASGAASVAGKNEGPVAKPGMATASRGSSRRTPEASKKRTTENAQNQLQDAAQENVSSVAEIEALGTAQSTEANPGATSAADRKAVVAEVKVTGWVPRFIRDAIVPTIPVRVGEDDALEAMREKLLREQEAFIPETFKRPATRLGFVFELVDRQANGELRWQDSPDAGEAKKSATGNSAEISWTGETSLRGGVQVLIFPDGREAARLTLNGNGRLALKAAAGVRSSFWLSVARAAEDETNSLLGAGQRAARFGWQVNKVPRQPQEPKLENQDERISFPLGSPEAALMELSLTDRVTDWELVTNIQIQTER